jgi:hypothetical protein
MGDDLTCDNCGHTRGEHPRFPYQRGWTMTPCRAKGCTCGDFHRDPSCQTCGSKRHTTLYHGAR